MSAMFCEHANEVLAHCPCPPDCYCKSHTCKLRSAELHPSKLRSAESMEAELRPRFEILRWAASRPGVLSLLEALRAANYDETGMEQLRRIVAGTGAKGERQVPATRRRCESCSAPAEHAEHFHDTVRAWCEEHTPWSGHFEFCGADCKALLAAGTGARGQAVSGQKPQDARYWVCDACGHGREEKPIGGLPDKTRRCVECGEFVKSLGHLLSKEGQAKPPRCSCNGAPPRPWIDPAMHGHLDFCALGRRLQKKRQEIAGQRMTVDGRGARCANCGESFAAGTHVARGQGVCEVPV